MRIRTDKRTGIKFADYMVGGKRKRVSLHTKNNEVAIIKAAKIADDKDSLKSGKMPFEAFLARFMEYLQATRRKGTIGHFRRAFKMLQNYKPVKYLQDITPAFLDELAIHEKAKIKQVNAAGLNRKIRALKTAMRQAEFWDLIPPQNWLKVSKFKERQGRVDFYTIEEVRQILMYLPEYRLIILLAYCAGLRRSEIAFLKWEDIDFEHNQIYVSPYKTDDYRYVPLVADLKKELEKAKKKAKSEYVIEELGECPREDKDFISAAFRQALLDSPFRRKGKGVGSLHILRHTFASLLTQNAADLYWVKNLMGHKDIKTTEKYAHLAPTTLQTAIKKLPKI